MSKEEKDTPIAPAPAPAPEKVENTDKKVTPVEKPDDKPKVITAKPGRIIVRNLGFDINEKHLKSFFGKYGEISEINIPSKSGNDKMNRGFAFVEFKSKEVAEKAIATVNNT
jgi:hypothetical protein